MPPMPHGCCVAEVVAETSRLILRTWDETDIVPFMAHLNTPAVMQWLGGLGDEQLYQTLYHRMVACQETHGHCFWIVERKADAALLGFCGLHTTPNPDSPVAGMTEIGWRLRADAWGQGYAREAAEASLDFGFINQDLPRIIAMTVPQNSASWGLMMRLGMIRARDLDFDHPMVDEPIKQHIVYSIDREDWTQ
jgi:RimJ/RimL family protein N-acetyltransferase